jgi:hypothetical protein
MADASGIAQGHHGALIRCVLGVACLKHFRHAVREMLQEIRAGCVDLGKDHP